MTPRMLDSVWGKVYSSACGAVCCTAVKKKNEMAPFHLWMMMSRWMCGVKLKDKLSCLRPRQRLGIEGVGLITLLYHNRWWGFGLNKEWEWLNENVWVMKWRVIRKEILEKYLRSLKSRVIIRGQTIVEWKHTFQPISTFSALGVSRVMRYINLRYLLTYFFK